ncbi:MAG: MaoC/PaaZ C-terminal domain-containing protein [Pseudomonadota bacterium]
MTSFFHAVPIGLERELGSYTFERNEIMRFAEKFDPQPFHLNDEAAEASLFGALCASGWHVTAVWMKTNIKSGRSAFENLVDFDGQPVFGPSPGVRNLRWKAPVFPGDTITFRSRLNAKRETPHRPGWGMLMSSESGTNQRGIEVMTFDGAVTVRTD